MTPLKPHGGLNNEAIYARYLVMIRTWCLRLSNVLRGCNPVSPVVDEAESGASTCTV
jgi:hypothetical protein